MSIMGRGDKKSKRGKISQGSYGKSRLGKAKKSAIPKPVDKPQE
ncbi:30S ribosomal protein THX [Spirosoma radiotolerans]